MKWFKHMCNASDDEFIAEIESEFGLEGYARWWKLLEVVGSAMGKDDRTAVKYPWQKWQTFLKAKRNKLETFLVALENKRKINLKQTGNILEINVPKMQELRDEWSKKLRSCSGVAPEQDTEVRVKNKELPPVVPPAGDRALTPAAQKTKLASRLPEGWEPDNELAEWAITTHPSVDYKVQTERFKLHFLANGKRMLSWSRAWQNWIARSGDFNRPNRSVSATLVPGNAILPSSQRKGGIVEI